jgi:hypothetical protein
VTAEDGRPPQEGGPARLVAGFSFLYTFVVTVLLLLLRDFFEDDANRDAVLLWLLVPVVSSFGTWMAVRSGFGPLRGWVWFGIVATMFFCWIAAFSIGLLYLPVPLFMMLAVVSPWDKSAKG